MSLNTKKILLVEDHPDTRELVLLQLQFMGFCNVVTAYSAYAALRIAEEEKPDLILMDIMLPGANGLEATRHLKGNPRTSLIPVVAITAKAMPGDREICLESGFDGYLPKPVTFRQLKKAIEESFLP